MKRNEDEANTAADRRVEICSISASAKQMFWLNIILFLALGVAALLLFLLLPWNNLSCDGKHSNNGLTKVISNEIDAAEQICPCEPTTERSICSQTEFSTEPTTIFRSTKKPDQINPTKSMLDTSDMNEYRNKRIKVLIFLQINFTGESDIKFRRIDERNLNEALSKIDISPADINVYVDSTSAEIQQILNIQSKNISSDYDGLVMFMVTRGWNNIFATKDGQLQYESLWEPFLADKCEQLKGKPKIVIIDAPRGTKKQAVVKMYKRGKRFAEDKTSTHTESYTIPVLADMLHIYSTVPDHTQYYDDNLISGGRFIHSLSKEIGILPTNTKFNFIDLLTRVNRRLALTGTVSKQCATFTSTLTKSLYFKTRTVP